MSASIRQETARRAQLTDAAIREIGEARSLNVTVGRIAKRAGVSPALAFHYFGDKEQLFLAAMRHILKVYADEVRHGLTRAQAPRDRLRAIIGASFASNNFTPEVISAWLNFYVLAQSSAQARRLLAVYHGRLHSNLLHALRPIVGGRAGAVAERIAGLIDGLYLRSAITPDAFGGMSARDHALAALDLELGGRT